MILAAVSLVAAACDGGERTEATDPTDTPFVPTTVPVDATIVRCGNVAPRDLDAVRALVELRRPDLSAVVSAGGGEAVIQLDGRQDRALADELCAPPVLALAPVQKVGTDPENTAANGVDGDNYVLGAAAPLSSVEARTELDPTGGWTVAMTIADADLAAWDHLVATCFERTPTCPLGQLAIVFDDVVLSAPAVQAPSIGAEVVISGLDDQDAANELVRLLGAQLDGLTVGAVTVGADVPTTT